MPIFIPNVYNIYNDTEQDERLFQLSHKIDKIDKCIELLIKTSNASCITTHQRAKFHSEKNLNLQGKPIIKITDIFFQYQLDGYVYESASPFSEKIEKILRLIFESGIISHHEKINMSKVRIFRQKIQFSEEVLLMQTVLIILSIGYTLSTVTFAGEFVSGSGLLRFLSR